MSLPVVAIAGFLHETNTFNPQRTSTGEFEDADGWPEATRSQNIFTTFQNLNVAIGGFIAEGTDFKLVPIVWCSAEPAGYVTHSAFEAYCGEICDGLREINGLDGVLLDLHGAMVVEGFEDGEGELLRRVRAIVGNIPVVIALDFHANISAELFALSSAITIYREYPHFDMAQTGIRAAKVLRRLLQDPRPLAKAFLQISYLIPLSSQSTDKEPFATIYKNLNDLETGDVISVDAAAGFPPADITDCGPSVLAYGDSQAAADAAAQALYDRYIDAEPGLPDDLLSEEQAIYRAVDILKETNRPVVLADVQDNPGAGGTGATTGILGALVRLDVVPAIVGIIADSNMVAQAHATGTSHEIRIEIQDDLGKNVTIEFDVIALSDAEIMCTGAMYRGNMANLGRTALLRVNGIRNDIQVMVSEKRFQCLDLGLLRHFGSVLEQPQIIVVKSTAHFRADFEPISK